MLRRTPLKRGAPLKQGKPLLRRTALAVTAKRRPGRRSTGPAADVVAAVLARDGHACVRCGRQVSGERGRDWSVHHRRPRRMGGDRRPDTNLPSNLVVLCGDGSRLCHFWAESHRAEAERLGWLLPADAVPSQMPMVHAGAGRVVWLTDDGRLEYGPPPIAGGER